MGNKRNLKLCKKRKIPVNITIEENTSHFYPKAPVTTAMPPLLSRASRISVLKQRWPLSSQLAFKFNNQRAKMARPRTRTTRRKEK